MYRLRDFSMRREQRLPPSLSQQASVKPVYAVDLMGLMNECEANFIRMKKLTQNMQITERYFLIERGNNTLEHKLLLLMQEKFTSTWSFEVISESKSIWLKSPKITVRIYHDAQLAEVIAWEGHRRFRPRYEYPNKNAYARDEKLQNNRFLGQWLSDCLQHGLSKEPIF